MKKQLLVLMLTIGLSLHVGAQESMEKVMEKRAREMQRVISLNDKEQWKKFVKENYTPALIDRPMRAKTTTTGSSSSASSSQATKNADNIEAKASMFQMLHADFGSSKIISIKPEGEKLTMVVGSNGTNGTFILKFDKNKPYLIDGLGIEVGDVNR